jgi:hypothetical protein
MPLPMAEAFFLLACEEISHLATESVVNNAELGVSLWFRVHCIEGKLAEKIRADGLTGRGFGLFCEPRWTAGPECVRGRSTYIWDCKLDSILSRHDYRKRNYGRARG